MQVSPDYMSAREVFSLFYERGECGSVATLYRGYFDDSADGEKEKYVIAGGLLAEHGVWTEFNRRWRRILHANPRISFFHTKEWKRLDGEFRQFRDAAKWPTPTGRQAADEKREKLKSVIEKTRVVALGVAVLVQDYRQVRAADPRAAEYLREDPYEGALQSFCYESAKALKQTVPKSQIAFVSDDSSRAHIYTAVYTDFKAKNPGIAKMMRGLAHLDDKLWPGLQASDIVANVTNQVFKRMMDVPEDQRQQLDSLPEIQGRFWKIAYWDKIYMCGVLLDTIGLDLYDKLGVPRRKHKSDDELEHEKQERIRKLRQSSEQSGASPAQ